MATAKRVGLYLRVSTAGRDQTVENQRRALTAAMERKGWQIVAEFCDEGISGAKGREKRPGFDRLHKAITRREIDIVAAWSVDRLGRSPGATHEKPKIDHYAGFRNQKPSPA